MNDKDQVMECAKAICDDLDIDGCDGRVADIIRERLCWTETEDAILRADACLKLSSVSGDKALRRSLDELDAARRKLEAP